MDDVLDLVPPAQSHSLCADLIRFFSAAATALAPATPASAAAIVAVFGRPAVFVVASAGFVIGSVVIVDLAAVDRGDVVFLGRIYFLEAVARDLVCKGLGPVLVERIFPAFLIIVLVILGT